MHLEANSDVTCCGLSIWVYYCGQSATRIVFFSTEILEDVDCEECLAKADLRTRDLALTKLDWTLLSEVLGEVRQARQDLGGDARKVEALELKVLELLGEF